MGRPLIFKYVPNVENIFHSPTHSPIIQHGLQLATTHNIISDCIAQVVEREFDYHFFVWQC